jgi:hypothetical protein
MNSIPPFDHLGLLAGLLFMLAGCNSVPPNVLQLAPGSEKDRELQTRHFEGIKETELLAAGAGVVQDLGFTLDESESKLGLITASRRLTSRRPLNGREVMGGLAWTVLVPYLGAPSLAYSAAIGIKEPQLVRITLVTCTVGGTASAATVRVTAQRVVYADESQVKIKSVEPLNDPAFYQEFFNRLSKSVFLEGQENAL